jgi:hypothetical protein
MPPCLEPRRPQGVIQGSDNVRCRRKTWVVGPPSKELSCFAQWTFGHSGPRRRILLSQGRL